MSIQKTKQIIAPQSKLPAVKKIKREENQKIDPRNTLNNLTGREWIPETKSVWFQRGLGSKHPDTKIERQHPAPFSFQDIIRLIKFFTKKKSKILDPFSGVSSTLKACAFTDRYGVGIELTKKWVDLSEERLNTEVSDKTNQKIIHGDSREVIPTFQDEEFDFIVTSPPYWGILRKDTDHKSKNERIDKNFDTKYSNNPDDLGNISDYDDFKKDLGKIFMECFRVLKSKKYMCVIVSDFRHGSDFIPFHIDTISLMTNAGFSHEGITILVQNAKKLYPYGYPFAFVSNIHHQYILIFRKNGGLNGNSDNAKRTVTI